MGETGEEEVNDVIEIRSGDAGSVEEFAVTVPNWLIAICLEILILDKCKHLIGNILQDSNIRIPSTAIFGKKNFQSMS